MPMRACMCGALALFDSVRQWGQVWGSIQIHLDAWSPHATYVAWMAGVLQSRTTHENPRDNVALRCLILDHRLKFTTASTLCVDTCSLHNTLNIH